MLHQDRRSFRQVKSCSFIKSLEIKRFFWKQTHRLLCKNNFKKQGEHGGKVTRLII